MADTSMGQAPGGATEQTPKVQQAVPQEGIAKAQDQVPVDHEQQASEKTEGLKEARSREARLRVRMRTAERKAEELEKELEALRPNAKQEPATATETETEELEAIRAELEEAKREASFLTRVAPLSTKHRVDLDWLRVAASNEDINVGDFEPEELDAWVQEKRSDAIEQIKRHFSPEDFGWLPGNAKQEQQVETVRPRTRIDTSGVPTSASEEGRWTDELTKAWNACLEAKSKGTVKEQQRAMAAYTKLKTQVCSVPGGRNIHAQWWANVQRGT